MFVSQYSVMLSRMSSRVEIAVEAPLEDLLDQPGLAGAVTVVDRERRQVDR